MTPATRLAATMKCATKTLAKIAETMVISRLKCPMREKIKESTQASIATPEMSEARMNL